MLDTFRIYFVSRKLFDKFKRLIYMLLCEVLVNLGLNQSLRSLIGINNGKVSTFLHSLPLNAILVIWTIT